MIGMRIVPPVSYGFLVFIAIIANRICHWVRERSLLQYAFAFPASVFFFGFVFHHPILRFGWGAEAPQPFCLPSRFFAILTLARMRFHDCVNGIVLLHETLSGVVGRGIKRPAVRKMNFYPTWLFTPERNPRMYHTSFFGIASLQFPLFYVWVFCHAIVLRFLSGKCCASPFYLTV